MSRTFNTRTKQRAARDPAHEADLRRREREQRAMDSDAPDERELSEFESADWDGPWRNHDDASYARNDAGEYVGRM